MAEPVVNHRMKVDFDYGWPTFTLTCDAPAESMCHVRFDCGCESWSEEGIEDGRPWHATSDFCSEDGEPLVLKHWGTLDPEDCGHRDYVSDVGAETGAGEIEFPVTFDWDGESYVWKVAPRPERFTLATDGYRITDHE